MTLVDCGVFEDMFVLFGLGQRIELCREQSTVKQTHCCEQSRKTSQINLTNWTRIKSKGIKRNRGESQGGFISFHFMSSDQRAQDQERDWTVEVCLTCKGHPKHGVFTVQTVHNVHQCTSMYCTKGIKRIQVACREIGCVLTESTPLFPSPCVDSESSFHSPWF